ncbi:MAG: polyisoprenyl-phosphate glycosyltransferase [Verrucomicrobia bacterium]|nr:polyisoprenyl-phosphate glycosyltransferase [Verrucomicrobiota bacterium]
MRPSLAETKISIVAPCYNEEKVLPEFVSRVTSVCHTLGCTYEVILINDGSRDHTHAVALRLAQEDPHLCVVNFFRNFGHQAAVTAGLDYATGDAIVLIDSDLQDPPEVIVDMFARWKSGVDVVYGQRRSREGESAFKVLTAKLFYRVLALSTDRAIPMDTGDFRLMDRKVVEVLKQMRERHRFIRGMVSWVGGRQEPVLYDRKPRFAGSTSYPFAKMLSFAIDAVTSFSVLPLRLLTYSALFVLAITLVMAAVVFVLKLSHPDYFIPGYASIMLTIMFFGGINLLAFGIIGEYLGRMFESVKGRPLYIVESIYPGKKP